ncbi:MAG: monovalent cation/H(+) antiporter subunit G [Robiginitomaculum sp.]|nr:monovalent cation/H(+) antiporter subunit G [Robiginitomaculum sp.]
MSGEFFHTAQMFIAGVLMIGGVFFVLAGAIGVIRMPDFYTRMHAAGVTDTLGAELILLGLIVQAGFSQTSIKLVFIAFFLFLTSPTATHAVVGAAWQSGLKPKLGKYKAPAPGERKPKPKPKAKRKAPAKTAKKAQAAKKPKAKT